MNAPPQTMEASRLARAVLVGVAVIFLLVVMPVVVRGEPLADDYHTCLRPTEIGLEGFLGESASRMGAVRPARFLEIFVIAPLCQSVPFGVLIAVPLALSLGVALLVHGTMRDLGLASPWPELAAALWLLHPLGTEAALWPSALHVPLGLGLALTAFRLFRRGRLGWGGLAALGACLSVEQVIFALPLAAWMTAPPHQRRRAAALTGALVAALVVVYARWPGNDPRAAVAFMDRVGAVVVDPTWFLRLPATGVGLHSIPLAVWWAFPISLVVLATGAWIGSRIGPRLLAESRAASWPDRQTVLWWTVGILALVALVNVPLIVTVPRGHSPRTFTPTWLVLSMTLPLIGARMRWSRPRWVGVGAGLFAAGALLSLALSVSVRLHTADFTETTSRYLAQQVPDGGVVAVCDVPRTVVEPAPVGSFALHEFMYDWAAQAAVRYHTGADLEVRVGGPMWGNRCPDVSGTDLVVSFQELGAASRR